MVDRLEVREGTARRAVVTVGERVEMEFLDLPSR